MACKGSKKKPHDLLRLRRYEWSASEGVWVRIDGSDDDWFLRNTADGLEAYPHPHFECPLPTCDQDRTYEHDTFQDRLQRASMDDGLLLI